MKKNYQDQLHKLAGGVTIQAPDISDKPFPSEYSGKSIL